MYARLPGALGAWVSPLLGPYTSNSESWAAGQALLAVNERRTYRVVVVLRLIVALFPVAGLKVYAAEATRSVKLLPSVEPWTFSVSLRVSQPEGRRSTSLLTGTAEPRS